MGNLSKVLESFRAPPLSVTERAMEAVKALGKDAKLAEARKWLVEKYGDGGKVVTDTAFYRARQEFRRLNKVTKPVATASEVGNVVFDMLKKPKTLAEVFDDTCDVTIELQTGQKGILTPESTQTVDDKEVAMSELRKIKAFCEANGGVERVEKVISCLKELE